MTDIVRLRSMLAGALCVTGLLAMPAVGAAQSKQQVGSHVVTWPSDNSLAAVQPGDTVRVGIAQRIPGRSAEVTLQRVTESGAPTGSPIARRTLRSGTFTARLPAGRSASYRLRVKSPRARRGSAFSQVIFRAEPANGAESCEYGDQQASLDLTYTELRAGETVKVTLSNTGTTCFRASPGLSFQVNRNGRWTDVPSGRPPVTGIQFLRPGDSRSTDFLVPLGTAPGEYRIVMRYDDEEISETFTVVA